MAYPVAMDTHPSLPPELWERTPPAIRAYIETLEGQVQTLTSMVHTLQGSIAEVLAEQFHETEPKHYISTMMKDMGTYYAETEKSIMQHLRASPFIHADETPVNIRGVTQYAWVFTNGKYSVFKLTATRDATLVHEFLTNYNGILISDFYPAYDAVPCRQQKCWVHLIRDLNNDLWAAPFDTELETFVAAVRDLIIPIMHAVQQYGLQQKHLQHFRQSVDQFYRQVILHKPYASEYVLTYQKRFLRLKMPSGILRSNGICHQACMSRLWGITLYYLVLGKHAARKENRFSGFCFRGRQTWIRLRHVNANGKRRVSCMITFCYLDSPPAPLRTRPLSSRCLLG